KMPRAPKRDRVVMDGQTLTLGNTTLKLYKTPGHTPGVTSFEFTVFDRGVPHKAYYSGGLGGRDGVRGFEQALVSVQRAKQMQGIEVYFANHGWNPGTDYPNGSIFERADPIRLSIRPPGRRICAARKSGCARAWKRNGRRRRLRHRLRNNLAQDR